MRVTVFCGMSIDGFIAEADGGLGFLDDFGNYDHGYTDHMASIDALVIGRSTYDTAAGFPDWPYAGKRVIVLTHRPIEAKHGETTHAGALRPLLDRLASDNVTHVYLDGGFAIRQGLDEGVIDAMVLSTVPVTLGAGRALFGGAAHTTRWDMVATRAFPDGLVQTTYHRRGMVPA